MIHHFKTRTALFIAIFSTIHSNCSAQIIYESLRLAPADTITDGFAYRVAYDDDIALLSASGDDDLGRSAGAAYLFDTQTGEMIEKLTAPDGGAFDFFSEDVAIHNNLAYIGAPGANVAGGRPGAVYVFDLTTRELIHKITAPSSVTTRGFGSCIAVSNDYIVIGAPLENTAHGINAGAAYIFDTSTYEFINRIVPEFGGEDDHFGGLLAIESDMIFIGFSYVYETKNKIEYHNGAALYDAVSGNEIASLNTANMSNLNSVDMDAGLIVLGGSSGFDGRAYVYDAFSHERVLNLAEHCPDILPHDGSNFGSSIAIGNGTVLVGARDYSPGGSAFVFDTKSWQQIARLDIHKGPNSGHLGVDIAYSPEDALAIVGDIGPDGNAAFVFDLGCPADLTGDDAVDFFDVSAFLAAFTSQDPAADFSGDGQFDFFDVSAFLSAFGQGCP